MKLFALVFLPLLVGWAIAIQWIIESWLIRDSYYSHGPLLPLVAAYVLWRRRAALAAVPARAEASGWWLLAPGLLLHLAGAALMVDSLSAASLLLAVPGAVWLAFGRQRLQQLLPVLGLLLFAIPMPMFVTGRVAFELKEIAVQGAVTVCQTFGLEVQRQAAALFVPPRTEALYVADACGGLRSLIGLTTIGYCLAFFFGPQTGVRRWLLLAAAMPLAVFTNVLRIVGICVFARWFGVPFATGSGHTLLGALEVLADVGLLLALDLLLSRRAHRP